MRPRVYVTQPIAASAAKRLREVARVTINPDSSRPLPKKNLLAAVPKTDVLFSLLHDRVDRDVLAANPKLRAVCSMAITPDAIDVAAATARGIPVTVVPPIVGEATADLNFGLIIAVARRMREGDRLLRQGGFPGGQSNHLAGAAVSGKVLGLIGGGGRIGRAVAKRAHGFSMEVLYWSPRRKPARDEQDFGIAYVPFDDLLARSDFISLHPPLNEETRHMISDREFALMKPTAFLINTARGPIVDEAALIRALTKKRIAGAGLDVYEHEPKVAMALRKMPNVVLTPHMGSAVASLREVMANIVVDNIVAILDGKPPPNCINPQVFDQ
ncbi:MAG TPA: D-glycerate dehydrogenase [Xanthobacteraceae bacterium]|nr:D-glycerate dehydrogenase [Xanthobacteraceae bacterium]